VGWIKLQSSETKIAGFFLVFDNELSTLDGADVSSATATSFIFPELEEQGFNQIHIANPNSVPARMTFELYSSGGSLRTSAVVRTVNANGAVAEYFSDLFPGVTPAGSDYIRVTSDQGVVPFSYFGVTGHDAQGVNGQDATKGASVLYSPQYVVGGPDWRTMVSVVNLDASPADVTFRFIDDNGVQIGSTKFAQIPARGKLWITNQSFFQNVADHMTQGYLEIRSNGAPLVGSVVFGDPQKSRYASALPLVSRLQSAVVFGQIASGNVGDRVYFTGLAMLNPSDTDANATIQLYDREGRQVASKVEIIPARRRKSRLLTEYFEGLTGQDIGSGYIRVTADRALASFALFGTKNTLSAVPAQIVP
jgi:hypothetical protein